MMDRTSRASWMSEMYWRKSKLAHSLALLTVVGLAATGTFAVEESAKLSNAGLTGIFPTVPPADLGEDEFGKLDGNWAEWSKSAAATVADFYSKLDKSDSVAQRQALGSLKVKLDVMRRALDDARYSTLHGPLAALYNSLALRIDLAEAALDTLELDSGRVNDAKANARTSELQSAITGLEGHLSPIPNGPLWLPYFKVSELKAALAADARGATALEAAKATQTKFKSRDYVLDEGQRKFCSRAAFETLSNAVESYISSAGWKSSPENTQKLRAEFKALSDSIDNYVVTGEKANELRHAFARVRFVSSDGGDRLASSLQKRLFNYNLRLLVSEDFLNKVMTQNRRETGSIRDCVLGANVNGCQITDTTVNVDLLPSAATARFALRLNGHICSNTTSTTPEATVWTAGNHVFLAQKEISFDGQNFSTQPATISVNPHNTTTGITTKFSNIPIIRGIANRIAAGEVEAKRGQAEAITASRVQDAVLPRFNAEADTSFSKASQTLEKDLFSGLRTSKLFPDTYAYQTSDRLLTVNIRLMAEDQVAADVPESSLMGVTGAKALLHESVINNAVDQMGLAGQTLNEAELRAKIETFLTTALNRPFKFDAPPPPAPDAGEEEKGLNAIIFATSDPIRIRIQNNELNIVIRAGFKQEGKEDIPMREITVPISVDVEGQSISVKRGNVIVAAAEGQGGGLAINSVVRKKIQSLLPDRAVDAKVEFKTTDKTMVAYVTGVKLADGWVAIAID